MTFLQPTLRTTQLARSAVLAFSLLAGSAWSAEAPPPEQNAQVSKLQSISNHASELAMQAMGMLGIHYKYGGSTPESGLDCSGLVRHIFKETWGLILPRTSVEISHVGKHVDKDDLQPGDLVFYNTLLKGFSHVGIYLGDRKFIHSPSAGGQVRIESMDIAYWKKRFNGGRRISEPEQDFPPVK